MDVGNINDTAVDELIQTLDHLCRTYVLQNNTAEAKSTTLFSNDSSQLMENARGFFMRNYQAIMKVRNITSKI